MTEVAEVDSSISIIAAILWLRTLPADLAVLAAYR